MITNVEVIKSGNESSTSVIRKFTRKLQGTGIVQGARKNRYFERQKSETVKKKKALKKLARTAKYQQLLKEGKVQEDTKKRGPRKSEN